jgi:ribonuclease T2
VHKNSVEESFWKHEWVKHGTCAAQLPILDSELKYFEQGIKLNERFPLYDWLAASSVTENDFYEYNNYFDAIKKKLGGKNPAIQCDYDKVLKVT